MTSKIEQAKQMLHAIETGKTDSIMANVSPDEYIQHNLQFGNGRDAILVSIPQLQTYQPKLEFLRTIEEGNYVAVQTHYTFSDQPVNGFDVFRFDGDKIVEHWDNLEQVTGNSLNGHTPFGGSNLDLSANTENTKTVANAFHKHILINKEFDQLNQYVSENIINHISDVADGSEAYQQMLTNNSNYQAAHFEVSQGDFSLLTSEGHENDQHVVYYDLVRIENNQVAEIWRTKEVVLPKDQWANDNGKF